MSHATSAEYGWLHCGPAGAGHFVKMVHNGVEYGIMQAYAEGFNILHEADAGSKYVKEGDAEVAPMSDPENYQYDIDVSEVAELWLVVLLLVVGYLTLPLMYYGQRKLASLVGEYQTVVRVVGLFTLLWILVYPLLLSAVHCAKDLTPQFGCFRFQGSKWYEIYVWRASCSLMQSQSWQYPLYVPPSIWGTEKVRITTKTDKYDGNGTAH